MGKRNLHPYNLSATDSFASHIVFARQDEVCLIRSILFRQGFASSRLYHFSDYFIIKSLFLSKQF